MAPLESIGTGVFSALMRKQLAKRQRWQSLAISGLNMLVTFCRPGCKGSLLRARRVHTSPTIRLSPGGREKQLLDLNINCFKCRQFSGNENENPLHHQDKPFSTKDVVYYCLCAYIIFHQISSFYFGRLPNKCISKQRCIIFYFLVGKVGPICQYSKYIF